MPELGLAILAGGKSSRMNFVDKCLLLVGSQTIIGRQIQRFNQPDIALCISANGDIKRFANYQVPIVQDMIGPEYGPLAGILSAGIFLRSQFPRLREFITIAADMPFLPVDLLTRLQATPDGAIGIARYQNIIHPTVGRWPLSVLPTLEHWLNTRNDRSLRGFVYSQTHCFCDWPHQSIDPFFNVNRPEDLVQAQNLLTSISPDQIQK